MTALEQTNDDERDHGAPLLLDPEALLLCGLMWASAPGGVVDRVCEVLDPEDFYNPHFAIIFALIKQRSTEGKSVDPASLRSALMEQGDRAALPHRTAERLLLDLATLGVTPEQSMPYADQVLGASYRRAYQNMAAALVHAGEAAPESELFAIMLDHGRRQRAAWERRHSFRNHTPNREGSC